MLPARLPRIHNRVLLVFCAGAALAMTTTGFLTRAPNRLASGISLPLWDAPASDWGIVVAAIIALGLLASVRPSRAQQSLTLLAALLLFAFCLIAAGDLARDLAAAGTRATRISLGPGFWLLLAIALLVLLDHVQRAGSTLPRRAAAVASFCAVFLLIAASGRLDALSLSREWVAQRLMFDDALLRHAWLVAATLAFAVPITMLLTLLLRTYERARSPVFSVLSLLQTIPSIALFGLLIAPLSRLAAFVPALAALGISGTGPTPAIIALCLYALLPLLRGSMTGFAEVPSAVKESARGLGFGAREIFWKVELPLALPALVSGLRIVTVQTIGLAAVAALIGAGGLGSFVFEGIGEYALDLVLVGALPIVLIAVGTDLVFQTILAWLRRPA